MAQILKFPTTAAKLGFKRVRRRPPAEHPDQLSLFPQPGAQLLSFDAGLPPFDQALLFDERGDPAAEQLYARAIAENDSLPDAWCNLGIIESQKGNTARAFDCFTTALKHEPRHCEAHYNLGNLYFDANDFRLAQFHYEMALEIDRTFANAHFNLALVLAINDNPAAALASLTTYQELVPADQALPTQDLLKQLEKSLAAAKKQSLGPK